VNKYWPDPQNRPKIIGKAKRRRRRRNQEEAEGEAREEKNRKLLLFSLFTWFPLQAPTAART
jgi:hypothetical protein